MVYSFVSFLNIVPTGLFVVFVVVVFSNKQSFNLPPVGNSKDQSKPSYTLTSFNSRNPFILDKCKVLIEKSVPRVMVWHHEALPSDA